MKLKRIILLLLTVMFSFSYGEVFAKDGSSLKKALKNKFHWSLPDLAFTIGSLVLRR